MFHQQQIDIFFPILNGMLEECAQPIAQEVYSTPLGATTKLHLSYSLQRDRERENNPGWGTASLPSTCTDVI